MTEDIVKRLHDLADRVDAEAGKAEHMRDLLAALSDAIVTAAHEVNRQLAEANARTERVRPCD